MINLNSELWNTVVTQAKRTAEAKGRQDVVRAIGRAVKLIDGNPYVEYDHATHTALIGSDSGHAYIANGTCHDETGAPCKGWQRVGVCKHRTAARLLQRLVEMQERVDASVGIPVVIDGKIVCYASSEEEADAIVSRALGFAI